MLYYDATLRKKLLSICLIKLVFFSSAFSSEIDSFQKRSLKQKNSASAINSFVNKSLTNALKQANSFYGCGKERLVDAVYNQLGGANLLGVGKVEKFLTKSNYVEKIHIPHKDSIYKDISFFRGSAFYIYGMGSLLRIENHFVGSDKLGHFFFDGWKYYTKAYGPRGKGKKKAISYGSKSEEGIFGYTMTGIYSYADLVANFHGLRFWNQILGNHPDPLNEKTVETFYKCTDNKWAINKKFKIEEYVDSSWDEAINCNKFETSQITKNVNLRISSTSKYKGCPISYSSCRELTKKYSKFKYSLLHPDCYGVDSRSRSLSQSDKE